MKGKKERDATAKRARRIWRATRNTTIPKDENGVSFDIHHRDGNWRNNDPANLQALSVLDHYRLHFKQGDWSAAWYIAQRLELTTDDYAEIRRKISAALKGRIMSPEWRAKISAALTGKKSPLHAIEARRCANLGRKHPPEFGKAIAERQRGTKASPEARRNMSVAHVGRKASPETKAKMSAARKGQYRDPAATRRMVETRRANGTYGRKSP